MKNNIRISLLVSALALLVQAPICADIHDRIEYKLNRVLRDVEIINNEIASECTTIVPKDFEDENGVLSQTYVIAAPGKYCLGANIDFEPLDEFTPAIVILSDAVSLNLNGFTLRQAEFNGTANAYGVQIGQGYFYDDPDAVLKNITISNGNITNFSAIGVFCYNGSFDGGASELAFQDLHFFDLNILDCGSSPSFDSASGIDLDSLADSSLDDPEVRVAFKNVIIDNCRVNRCVGTTAIIVYTGDNVEVSNTQANEFSSSVEVFGFTYAHAYFARNVQMYNCQGNGTKNTDPNASSTEVGGCSLQPCINVYVKDCQFNDAYADGAALLGGANFSNTQNGVFENVQFNNTRGGEFAVFINGVHMSDGALQQTQANGIKFINCQFNGTSVSPDNVVPGRAIHGFFAQTVRNIAFESCQACNIITENSSRSAFGFRLGTNAQDPIAFFANARNFSFNDCVATDIESPNAAIGYYLLTVNANRRGTQASLDNIVLENCIAERIHSSSDSERVAGILEGLSFSVSPQGPFPAEFNLFIKNCRVSDVRAGQENELSAGIIAESVHRPVIIGNSVSDCDRGILLTGIDEITPNNLFQLAETLDDALAFPPVFIDLNTIPSAAPAQNFNNITQANSISIAPSAATINTLRDYLFAPTDLNTLGWQAGDQILYDANGGSDISDLVSTTTYYLIVYVPGFSENGVIEQNEVDNCSVSGYQDDAPVTSSAWVDNLAFNDGTPASAAANYDITWAGVAPVDAGTLAAYPVGGNKYYNLSLIP